MHAVVFFLFFFSWWDCADPLDFLKVNQFAFMSAAGHETIETRPPFSCELNQQTGYSRHWFRTTLVGFFSLSLPLPVYVCFCVLDSFRHAYSLSHTEHTRAHAHTHVRTPPHTHTHISIDTLTLSHTHERVSMCVHKTLEGLRPEFTKTYTNMFCW